MKAVKIGDFWYVAINDGGITWMVRRFTHEPVDSDTSSARDDDQFVEALISVETSDRMTVIQAAIDRRSWE